MEYCLQPWVSWSFLQETPWNPGLQTIFHELYIPIHTHTHTHTHTHKYIYIHIYIYIYIYIPLRKTKSGHNGIINLFPSCYGHWYELISTNLTGLHQIHWISKGSEEVLLNLLLLIHISAHSRMEINFKSKSDRIFFFLKELLLFFKQLLLCDVNYIELFTRKI